MVGNRCLEQRTCPAKNDQEECRRTLKALALQNENILGEAEQRRF